MTSSRTLREWQQHGDHPGVEPYGPSLLDHMPAYAACGFVTIDHLPHHVAPGAWLLVDADTVRAVWPAHQKAEAEHALAQLN